MARKITIKAKLAILFGGPLNQIGWFVLGFGSIFFWAMAMKADLSSFRFNGPLAYAQGTVIESFETNYAVNERSVYENHYTFFTSDGQEIRDFSYATGRFLKTGDSVSIEYPKGEPEYSRIRGMRRQVLSAGAIFIAVIPGAGLILLVISWRKRVKQLKLLQSGILSNATLLKKTPTMTSVNEQTVYKLEFEFQDSSNVTHTLTEKTHLTDPLLDDKRESVLYLAAKPDVAVLVDSLVKGVKIESENVDYIAGGVMKFMILPTVVILGQLWYLLG